MIYHNRSSIANYHSETKTDVLTGGMAHARQIYRQQQCRKKRAQTYTHTHEINRKYTWETEEQKPRLLSIR